MTNPKMTEEQRMELAEKLDTDLDEYLRTREKRPYTEGWNEATWEQVSSIVNQILFEYSDANKPCELILQEMEQHPFFMQKLPEEGEPLPPLLEAIQQLKYDPNENTSEGFRLPLFFFNE